jgi:hypothetical protein
MNYENDIYRKPLPNKEEDEWNRIEMRNQTGGMPVIGENHPLTLDPNATPLTPVYYEPVPVLPEEKEDDGGWGDLMKQVGGSMGGGQVNRQPLAGTQGATLYNTNAVQQGGFGRYKGILMGKFG